MALSQLTVYLKNGFALVPAPLGSKGPTQVDWNLRKNAVTEAGDIARLSRKNVGLLHAYCQPSPTCAIDIDEYNLAKGWLNDHGIDLKELLLAPDALVIGSGRRCRAKLIYRLPESAGVMTTKQISCQQGNTILEFRCASRTGLSVQDLLPPSIHPSGSHYRWLGSGSLLSLPTIPSRLLAIWQGISEADQAKQHHKSNNVRITSPRDLAVIKDALTYISADCGYIVWRNVVWALLSSGWQHAEDIACAWSETAPDRFDLEKFELLVNTYNANIQCGYTIGTIYHYARMEGWDG